MLIAGDQRWNCLPNAIRNGLPGVVLLRSDCCEGTLPGACFADGMTGFLKAHGIQIFDYPQFALPLRERIRERAQALAQEYGVSIEHITKAHIPKEDVLV